MARNVTKMELARRLTVVRPALSVGQAVSIIDGLTEILTGALAEGESIRINGLGTLQPVTLKARKGRDIRRGRIMEVPEQKTVKFRVHGTLKRAVNGDNPYYMYVASTGKTIITKLNF